MIRKAETTTGNIPYKEYVNGLFKISVLESDGISTIFTNNDEQKHDIDLDELEYLEEIYKQWEKRNTH